ncbi:hypothetical protein ACC733_37440, partial [Rhizobium johnstonii]
PPQRGRSAICGRGDVRHTVRVNSSMGLFFSGYIKSYGAIGDNRLIAVVSLSEQGYSGRRSGLAMSSSINSLSLLSTFQAKQGCSSEQVENNDN